MSACSEQAQFLLRYLLHLFTGIRRTYSWFFFTFIKHFLHSAGPRILQFRAHINLADSAGDRLADHLIRCSGTAVQYQRHIHSCPDLFDTLKVDLRRLRVDPVRRPDCRSQRTYSRLINHTHTVFYSGGLVTVIHLVIIHSDPEDSSQFRFCIDSG